MAEDHEIGRAAVKKAERDARETRVRERALPLDHDPVGALGGVADHELRRSRDEVRHDRVDGDPAAGDRDSGLTGRDELDALARPAQRRDDLERDGHLPHRCVRSDGEDDPDAFAPRTMTADRQVPRRLAELAHLRTSALCRGGEHRIGEHPLVQSVPDLDAALECTGEGGPVPVGDATARSGRADE